MAQETREVRFRPKWVYETWRVYETLFSYFRTVTYTTVRNRTISDGSLLASRQATQRRFSRFGKRMRSEKAEERDR
jgi:hypothetical protein